MTAPLLCAGSEALPEAECLREGSRALLEAQHRAGVWPRFEARPSVRAVIAHAAALRGIGVAEVTERSRRKVRVDVRRAVAFVARRTTPRSYPEIGMILGGCGKPYDHSTVIHLDATCEKRMGSDPEFARFVERLWAAAECFPLADPVAIANSQPEEPAPVTKPRIDLVEDEYVVSVPWRAPPEQPGEYRARHALPLTPDMIDPHNAGLRSVRAGHWVGGAA